MDSCSGRCTHPCGVKTMKMRSVNIVVSIFLVSAFLGCGGKQNSESSTDSGAVTENATVSSDPKQDKGIGPVKNLQLPDQIDEALVAKGTELFNLKCTACHKPDKKYIGPAPTGVLDRRSPEWIMNMILNPEKMIAENSIAKQLLAEYNGAPMANQNLTEDEARAILEYFRTLK